MTRRLAVLLVAPMLWASALAQPPTDSLRVDSLAVGSAASESTSGAAAQRSALDPAAAAFDSLLAANGAVLAARVDSVAAARPWWRRWAGWLVGGLVAVALAGAGAFGYRRLSADVADASRGSTGSAAAAQQAAARVDAAVARLHRDVNAKLVALDATRATIEAQLAQTRDLLDRAERAGLFRATFADAVAAPPAGEAPGSPPTDPAA
jgi:hypothetical protein